MSRLFISHASADNSAALALVQWLTRNNCGDYFLGHDPDRGPVPAERRMEQVRAAADRCEAVLCLTSPAWIASERCADEFRRARDLRKRILVLIVADIPRDDFPKEMMRAWQPCDLVGPAPFVRFAVAGKTVAFSEQGLQRLLAGLQGSEADPLGLPSDNFDPAYPRPREMEAKNTAIAFGRNSARIPAFGARGERSGADDDTLDAVGGATDAAVREALAEPGRPPAIPASPEAQRDALRAAFIPWLVAIDPASGEIGRRVAGLAEIPEKCHGLVERFAAARLLVLDKDGTVKIADQALLRQWSDLVGWLRADDAALRLAAEIERAADAWVAGGRREELLDHRAERLDAAEALLRREDFRRRSGAMRITYVAAWREHAERKQKERKAAQAGWVWLRRRAVWVPAAAVVAAVGLLGVSHWFSTLTDIRVTPAERQAALTKQPLENGALKGSLDAARRSLNQTTVDLQTKLAQYAPKMETVAGGLRFAVLAARIGSAGVSGTIDAIARLAAATRAAGWRIALGGHKEAVSAAAFSPDGAQIVTASYDHTARVWNAVSGQIIATLYGHEGPVNTATFSPDTKRIVTASDDNTARVWDAASGQVIATLRGHDGPVTTAVFSPNGERVVTASDDRTARVWDAASGQVIAALYGHEGPVKVASFSPDGGRIVTASNDHTARVWDATSGRPIATLEGHEGPVNTAAFSPDGERVVTASADKTARVWDAMTGQLMAVLRSHEGDVNSASFSPDGKRIVTASDDHTAGIWDAVSGHLIAKLQGHGQDVRTAAFSPDGAQIVTASADHSAGVWDAASGRLIEMLRGHDAAVTAAAFSPDSARIVTASGDHTARIWGASTWHAIAVLRGHEARVRTAVFSMDGRRVVSASDDHTARVWDAATGQPNALLRGHEGSVNTAAFSPDDTRVVSASDDHTARVWNAATGQPIALLRGHEGTVNAAAFSPDGTRVVTASDDHTVRVWDAATGQPITVFRGHEAAVNSAAFSPDGTRVVTASDDRTICVWDAGTGRLISRGWHAGAVNYAAFSQDGTRVVSAGDDRTAVIMDAMSGQRIAVLPLDGAVKAVAFNHDDTLVITASKQNAAHVWDAKTGQIITTLDGHQGEISSAGFSRDGSLIVTASKDDTARVWDAVLGRPVAILLGDTGPVNAASFSPDGTRLVTASDDRTVRIWDAHVPTMTPGQVLSEACNRRLRGISTLTRAEMDMLGYPAGTKPVDVCKGVSGS